MIAANDRVKAEYRTINRQYTGFCRLPDNAVSLVVLRLEASEHLAASEDGGEATTCITPKLQLQPKPCDKTSHGLSCSYDIRYLNGQISCNLAAPSIIIRFALGMEV